MQPAYLQLGQRMHVCHEVQHVTDVLPHALHGRRPALKHTRTPLAGRSESRQLFSPDCGDRLTDFPLFTKELFHFLDLWLTLLLSAIVSDCPHFGQLIKRFVVESKEVAVAYGRQGLHASFPLGDLTDFCLLVY